jgi:hypothetical protein
VIKYTNDPHLSAEIRDERKKKKTIENINFGYKSILFPTEFLFEDKREYTILITEFIPQESTFTKLSLERQFFLALQALEAFEGVHSVVSSHDKALRELEKPYTASKYLDSFKVLCEGTRELLGATHKSVKVLEEAYQELLSSKWQIEKYCDFITHDDFVPHNMRVKETDVVVLDHSSLILGNKYESWARFINFMLIFNFELSRMLSQFVLDNRGEEEYEVLNLMRIYKIGFLINFYAKSIGKTSGKLNELQKFRLDWWTNVCTKLLNNEEVTLEDSNLHNRMLDELRDEEEKKRQEGISR